MSHDCDHYRNHLAESCRPEDFINISPEALEHLASCAHCTEWFRLQRKTDRLLRDVGRTGLVVESPSQAEPTEVARPVLEPARPAAFVSTAESGRIFMSEPRGPSLPSVVPPTSLANARPTTTSIADPSNPPVYIVVSEPGQRVQGLGRRNLVWLGVFAAGAVSVGVAALILMQAIGTDDEPAVPSGPAEHEVLTTSAWDAYIADDFAKAITLASQCIDEFEGKAKDMQRDLSVRQATFPIGQASEKEQREVFLNGPLNDVATCLYIRGRSYEKTDDKAKADQDFRACSELTLARCWDVKQQLFWSPAEMAGYRVDKPENQP